MCFIPLRNVCHDKNQSKYTNKDTANRLIWHDFSNEQNRFEVQITSINTNACTHSLKRNSNFFAEILWNIMKTRMFLLRFYVWHKSNKHASIAACSRTSFQTYFLLWVFFFWMKEKNKTKDKHSETCPKKANDVSYKLQSAHYQSFVFAQTLFSIQDFHCIRTRNAHFVLLYLCFGFFFTSVFVHAWRNSHMCQMRFGMSIFTNF